MKKVFLLSILLSAGSLFISPSSVDAVAFTRRVFLQNVTTNSIEFRWVTDTQEQLTIKYGTSPSYGGQVTSDTVSNCGGNTCTGGNNNHAKITGLAANTKYFYQVVSSGGTALTPAGDTNYYFKTAPPAGSTTPFSFVIWGDSGNGGASQKNVAKQVAARNPDLAFIAGDIVYGPSGYSNNFADNNTYYFNVYSDTAASQNSMRFTPYYVTCGNHETSCPAVIADHSMPGGGNMGNGVESTYSFDYGNAHFVALNSNSSYALTDPQMTWAANDLRSSNQPWKMAFWHHNYWSSGSHSTLVPREPLVRMSNDAGADLVFWGHSHVFERWNRNSTYPNLQLYTIGNGGQRSSSSCTASSPGPGCAAKSNGEAGFIYAQVNGNQMTLQYVTENGSVTDSITLNSGGGGPTSPPGTSPTRTPTPIFVPTRTPTPSQIGPPTIRITEPVNGATTGRDITVRYTKSGDLGQVSHVSLQIDNHPEIQNYTDVGFYYFSGLSPGTHTITVYLVRADGSHLPNSEAMHRITVNIVSSTIPSPTPSGSCPLKSSGDANCDGRISLIDFEIWRREFTGMSTTINADFNGDGRVTLVDFEAWRRPFTGAVVVPSPTQGHTNPTATPTHGGNASPTPQTGELSIAVCDRTNGPFSLNINNSYFPLPVGQVRILEGSGEKVQISVLNQTKVIGGVTTRVVEERHWTSGNLVEISYNWFVQAPNGTVCYYGEDVFDGSGNIIGGTWIAYDDPAHPNFRPGIIMPANPAVGQTYYQEVAPGVAQDRANHVRFEPSFNTPAGSFHNVLYVEEIPASTKRYAPGIGLIFDAGTVLTRL